MKTIAMIGGTGFIGRHLACELARRGYSQKILTRRRERTKSVIVFPNLELIEADVHDPKVLESHFTGCDAVINLAGILNERRRGGFDQVHATLPERIVAAAANSGVRRLLHVSALGAAEDAPSRYLRSKAAGEAVIAASGDKGMAATWFRPSVVFGQGDSFVTRFAQLLSITPAVLPLTCADARITPVYVEDVARAMANALENKGTVGACYELCGPSQYTLSALVRYVGTVTGNERSILELGRVLSRLQAHVMQNLPGKLLTIDNVDTLSVPSICDGDDLLRLGIHARALESVVPDLFGDRNKQAQYDSFRTVAGRDTP